MQSFHDTPCFRTAAMSAELARVVDESSLIVEDLEGKVEVLIEDVNKFTL